jgi:pimeloyl-ACP methyl ester carboxylesterase
MDSGLQINVLGELKVARNGNLLPLPASKKTRALLAYLAVVGRPVRRDYLCDLFWERPDDPRAALRWSLHKIRKLINCAGQNYLSADNSRAFLDPHRVDLDFRRIPQLQPIRIESFDIPALESLASTFTGEFFEDLHLPNCPKFEAWRVYHADALTQVRARVLQALIDRTREQPERALFHEYSLKRICSEGGSADKKPREPARAAQAVVPPLEPWQCAFGGAARAQRLQDIRFCQSRGGTRLAYAICGRGRPLARAAHWMSHLQHDWESPVWRHWIDALSETTTLVRYDQRGNGLSDRDAADLSFEAMVDDLESVVNAAQLTRFTLLGVSQSCAVSAAYAARHPERVSCLILYGGFVKGWRRRGDRHEIAKHEAMTALIREGWGDSNSTFRQLFTNMFIPGASAEQTAWFNDLQRVAVSADLASRLHEAFGEIDVSALLADIRTPTLVLHARHDSVVPFHAGREFAVGIRGARLVELNSANHILLAHEPAFLEFRRQVSRFMATASS